MAFFIVLTVAASSQSTPEPYAVKSDKLGESITQWKVNNPRLDDCRNSTIGDRPGAASDPYVVYCSPRGAEEESLTYATAPLLTEIAWFYKSALYKVEMPLHSRARLSQVMTGLEEKFGAPSGRETTPFQNGLGARFEQEGLTWKNGVSTIEIVYSNSPGNAPVLTFVLDAPDKEVTKRWKEADGSKARSDM